MDPPEAGPLVAGRIAGVVVCGVNPTGCGCEYGRAVWVAGVLAGSIAFIGFGFDSVIENLSGAVLLWRLVAGEEREKLTLRLIGHKFSDSRGVYRF